MLSWKGLTSSETTVFLPCTRTEKIPSTLANVHTEGPASSEVQKLFFCRYDLRQRMGHDTPPSAESQSSDWPNNLYRTKMEIRWIPDSEFLAVGSDLVQRRHRLSRYSKQRFPSVVKAASSQLSLDTTTALVNRLRKFRMYYSCKMIFEIK